MPLKFIIFLVLFFCGVGKYAWAIEGVVVVSTDQAFHDKWNYTLGTHSPQISQNNTVYVGQKFSLLLFISHFAMGSQNQVDVEYDMLITDPDGRPIFDRKNINGLKSQVFHPNQVLLSESSLNVSLDSTERLGEYEIFIRLHDRQNGSTSELKDTLILSTFTYQPFFISDDPYLAWQQHYYRNPQPEMAVDAFLYFARSEDLNDSDSYWANFTFFLEVFRSNAFLLPTLVSLYPDQSPAIRTQILCLLRFVGYQNRDFVASLSELERKTLEQLQKQQLADPFGEIASPQQLEMLWQVFLATGKFATIQGFVAQLENARFQQYAAYRSAKPADSTENQEDIEATLGLGIYEVATLTLVTQCETHPLVRQYCEYIYERAELTDIVSRELGDILGKGE